jgi:hypothetical protein
VLGTTSWLGPSAAKAREILKSTQSWMWTVLGTTSWLGPSAAKASEILKWTCEWQFRSSNIATSELEGRRLSTHSNSNYTQRTMELVQHRMAWQMNVQCKSAPTSIPTKSSCLKFA